MADLKFKLGLLLSAAPGPMLDAGSRNSADALQSARARHSGQQAKVTAGPGCKSSGEACSARSRIGDGFLIPQCLIGV